jgi:non-ribosomal peptide synthetase component F
MQARTCCGRKKVKEVIHLLRDHIEKNLADAKKYWKDALKAAKTSLLLPGNYYRTGHYAEEIYSFQLDQELNNNLILRSKNHTLLEYVIFLSCLKIMLYKLTGITKIVIGSPVYPDSQINKFVLFSDSLQGDMTFREVIKDVGETVKRGYEYQYYPLDEAMEWGQNGCGRENMTRYFLSYEEIHRESAMKDILSACRNELAIIFRKEEGSFTGQVIYNGTVYKQEMIENYIKAYLSILHQAVNCLDIRLRDFSLCRDGRPAGSIGEAATGSTMIDLFEKNVSSRSAETALTEGSVHITYGGLNKKANRLSNKLIGLGAGAGKTVCVMTDNTAEAVIAIVGIMKAGAVFVLINPNLPEAIRDAILCDSKADILLLSTAGDEVYPIPTAFIMQEETQDTFLSSRRVRLEDLACISYSISEGAGLLGTLISQNQLVNKCGRFCGDLGISPEQRMAICVTVMPAASLWVICLILLHHMHLYILPEYMLHQSELLAGFIERHEIKVLLCPAVYAQRMKELNTSYLEKIIAPGGEEALAYDFSVSGVETLMLYGPAEYFPYVGVYDSKELLHKEAWRSINRGTDCPDVLILDADGRPVPEGVPGDLYIAGKGIALGYNNNPERTNERYIRHPLDKNIRILKTEAKARGDKNGLILVYQEPRLKSGSPAADGPVFQLNGADASVGKQVEHRVTKLFQDILKLDHINRDAGFLEAGGNSILLMRLVAELNKIYPNAIKVSDVFTYSTIAAISSRIVGKLTQEKEENTRFESIQNRAIPIPPEYFVLAPDKSGQTTLMYEFDEELRERLTAAAGTLNVDLFSIVCAVFIYVLSGLSGQKRLQVQYVMDRLENIGFVEADFELMKNVRNYFMDIDFKVKNNEIIYNLNSIDRINEHAREDKIVPLCYDMKTYHFDQKILSLYDIILGLRASADDSVHLIYRYNGLRINGDKAKELFYLIISYVKEMVNPLF